jgi:hypothetical protein
MIYGLYFLGKEKMNNQIDNYSLIGKEVCVINKGMTYAHFNKLAELLKLKKWKAGSLPSNNELYYVTSIEIHPNFRSDYIAVITDNEHEYLVSVKGLKMNNEQYEKPQTKTIVFDVNNLE